MSKPDKINANLLETLLIQYTTASDLNDVESKRRIRSNFEAYISQRELKARIDEVNAALSLAGKAITADGHIIDYAGFEGGDPGRIQVVPLKQRLATLQSSIQEEGNWEGANSVKIYKDELFDDDGEFKR